MGYYSFNRPRRDGRLSWPCWLTDSGRLTHKVVTWPAISLAQDRERMPARTGSLTTMLRHQLMSHSIALNPLDTLQSNHPLGSGKFPYISHTLCDTSPHVMVIHIMHPNSVILKYKSNNGIIILHNAPRNAPSKLLCQHYATKHCC